SALGSRRLRMTSNERPRRRRRYTPQERQDILRDAEKVGVGEAARQHGIPESTLFNWRHRLRLEGAASAGLADSPAAPEGTLAADDEGAEGGGKPSTSRGSRASRLRPARRYTPSEKAR